MESWRYKSYKDFEFFVTWIMALMLKSIDVHLSLMIIVKRNQIWAIQSALGMAFQSLVPVPSVAWRGGGGANLVLYGSIKYAWDLYQTLWGLPK